MKMSLNTIFPDYSLETCDSFNVAFTDDTPNLFMASIPSIRSVDSPLLAV